MTAEIFAAQADAYLGLVCKRVLEKIFQWSIFYTHKIKGYSIMTQDFGWFWTGLWRR